MGTSGVAGTQRLCVKAGALKVSLRRAMGSHGVCVCEQEQEGHRQRYG